MNKIPKEVIGKGKKKLIWKLKPVIDQLKALFPYAADTQLRRTVSGGLRDVSRSFAFVISLFIVDSYTTFPARGGPAYCIPILDIRCLVL